MARLNPAGSALVYSTYLGGSNGETKATASPWTLPGNAYVTGIIIDRLPHCQPVAGNQESTMAGSTTGFVAEFAARAGSEFLPREPQLRVSSSTTSPPQSVTVTNLGNATLSITNITASGDFALVTTATSLPVRWWYVGGRGHLHDRGDFYAYRHRDGTGTLTITYNGAGSPETIALSGTGMAPAPKFSPRACLRQPAGRNNEFASDVTSVQQWPRALSSQSRQYRAAGQRAIIACLPSPPIPVARSV